MKKDKSKLTSSQRARVKTLICLCLRARLRIWDYERMIEVHLCSDVPGMDELWKSECAVLGNPEDPIPESVVNRLIECLLEMRKTP